MFENEECKTCAFRAAPEMCAEGEYVDKATGEVSCLSCTYDDPCGACNLNPCVCEPLADAK